MSAAGHRWDVTASSSQRLPRHQRPPMGNSRTRQPARDHTQGRPRAGRQLSPATIPARLVAPPGGAFVRGSRPGIPGAIWTAYSTRATARRSTPARAQRQPQEGRGSELPNGARRRASLSPSSWKCLLLLRRGKSTYSTGPASTVGATLGGSATIASPRRASLTNGGYLGSPRRSAPSVTMSGIAATSAVD